MTYKIHSVVVVGAGTMGAALAAQLANIGVPVTLLDIVPNKLKPEEEAAKLTLKDKAVRNRIVNEGWDRCIKARPANLMSSDLATLVKLGNLEDDFDAIAKADWIVEAIVENLKIKQDLMTRIDAVRKPEAHHYHQHFWHPDQGYCRRTLEGFQEAFPGDSLFQPAALFEAAGDHPNR